MLEGQLSQLSSEVERLFDEARNRARRELADQLNQSVRRIRQSGSLDELAATLLDAAMAFAAGAAVFRIAEATLKGEKIRGVAAEQAADFPALEMPLSAAPALAGAVESRDPVIAVTTAAEVSDRLVSLASHPAEGRAYIYPLVVKGRVPALLYAWGAVQGAALEMLTQVAGAVWDSLVVPEAPAPVPEALQLVTIAPAPAPVSAWDALPAEDQAIHLRAQRFARVQIAEMRLQDPAEGRAYIYPLVVKGRVAIRPDGTESLRSVAGAYRCRARSFSPVVFRQMFQHGGLHPCRAGADLGS